MIGGIALTQEMLDFCAEHDIVAEVEVISADEVNEAYERVLASEVRYRFVIDAGTMEGDGSSGRRGLGADRCLATSALERSCALRASYRYVALAMRRMAGDDP